MLTEILIACTVRFKSKNSKLIGQKLKGSNGTLIRILPQLFHFNGDVKKKFAIIFLDILSQMSQIEAWLWHK